MKKVLVGFCCLTLAGCPISVTRPGECLPDAGVSTVDDSGIPPVPSISGFRLTVLTDPVEFATDEDTTLVARIDRAAGYTNPILVEAGGMPDGVTSFPRENRFGDPGGLVTLILSTSEDGTGTYRVARFAVWATDQDGLRNTYPVTFTVRP